MVYVTSLCCHWQTRAARYLTPSVLYTDVTVSVINWWPTTENRRWPRWAFAEIFGSRRPESLGYRVVLLHDPMFSCFGTVPACDGRDGRTDRQKDRHDESIYRVCVASRGKKRRCCVSYPSRSVKTCQHGNSEITGPNIAGMNNDGLSIGKVVSK